MFLNVVLVMICISLFLSALSVFQLKKEQAKLSSVIDGSFYNDENTGNDSAISEHVALRDAEFDERINKMREELGLPKVQGHTAEILHPDVENLPHESIYANRNLPLDDEYAE